MTKRWLKVALVISLSFNFAVFATLAYGWIDNRNSMKESVIGSDAARRSFVEKSHRLAGYIGLSEEKTCQFEKIMLESHSEAQKYRENLQEDRNRLVALLKEDQPQEKAMMAAVDSISIHQRDLEKVLVRRISSVRSILNQEESERFVELIECSLRPKCCERQGTPRCRTIRRGDF